MVYVVFTHVPNNFVVKKVTGLSNSSLDCQFINLYNSFSEDPQQDAHTSSPRTCNTQTSLFLVCMSLLVYCDPSRAWFWVWDQHYFKWILWSTVKALCVCVCVHVCACVCVCAHTHTHIITVIGCLETLFLFPHSSGLRWRTTAWSGTRSSSSPARCTPLLTQPSWNHAYAKSLSERSANYQIRK